MIAEKLIEKVRLRVMADHKPTSAKSWMLAVKMKTVSDLGKVESVLKPFARPSLLAADTISKIKQPTGVNVSVFHRSLVLLKTVEYGTRSTLR